MFKSIFIVCFINILVLNFVRCELTWNYDGPIVKIEQGVLKGILMKTLNNKPFAAFMSIPYAEPPLGQLRFKEPIEAKPWEGILNARKDPSPCIQIERHTKEKNVFGSEDCLYLNVYVPKISDNNKLLPVMVYFHGGSWLYGSGNKFYSGPRRFLDKEVILIGVNYRLGALGLLTTNDEVAPGNLLFKDQNLALKWVQKHIKNFGGDSNLVTIFGSNSGAASVQFHLMSPLSQGLFHRAIIQSGSALCSWAYSPPGYQVNQFKRLGKILNCPIHESQKMVECLRKITATDIVSALKYFYVWDIYPITPFGPIIEPKSDKAFLVEDPRVSLKEGHFSQIPIMMGFNKNEGGLHTSAIMAKKGLLEEFSINLFDISPFAFNYQDSQDTPMITAEIMNFYIKSPELNRKDFLNISRIFSDAYTTSGVDESVKFSLENSKEPIYFYFFGYKGKYSYSNLLGDPTKNYGVTHEDELMYLFDISFLPKLNKKDLKVSDAMVTIWTNFALTGNPTQPIVETKIGKIPEWPPLDSVDQWKNMEIGKGFKVNENLFPIRRILWRGFPLWPKKISLAYVPIIKSEL